MLLSVLKKNLKTYLGVLGIALVLPIVLWGATGRNHLFANSQASDKNTLRLWTEPAAVITQSNQPVELVIMGEYYAAQPMGTFTLTFHTPPGITVSPQQLAVAGWSGSKLLGTVQVSGRPGIYEIGLTTSILQSSLPNLEVVTQPARVTVR